MQENEAEIAADGADHFGVEGGRVTRSEFCTVTDYGDGGWIDSFREYAIAHVIAEDDYAGGAAQGPAMELFPDAGEEAGLDDGAADGHVRVEVADVVNVGLVFQEGDECADDAFERRVGHGQDDVAGKKQRAGHSQENVAEVVEQALFHLCARVIGRAGADDLDPA
jgi:hypothetical protein